LTFIRSTIPLVAVALLAACHGSSPKTDRRSASGEVLQGTISDAMLPVDKLKSQGPTLAPTHGKGAAEGAADETSAAADATSESSDNSAEQATPAAQTATTATP
jgi:hypothetical protein